MKRKGNNGVRPTEWQQHHGKVVTSRLNGSPPKNKARLASRARVAHGTIRLPYTPARPSGRLLMFANKWSHREADGAGKHHQVSDTMRRRSFTFRRMQKEAVSWHRLWLHRWGGKCLVSFVEITLKRLLSGVIFSIWEGGKVVISLNSLHVKAFKVSTLAINRDRMENIFLLPGYKGSGIKPSLRFLFFCPWLRRDYLS